jgi:peptidyl-prolyl cis-trans isomerase B (cyclophilin B)
MIALAAFFWLLQVPAAPQPASVKDSIEASPPIWTEGDPLRCKLTFENPSSADITIPVGWTRGDFLYMRDAVAASSKPAAPSPAILAKKAEAALSAAGANERKELLLPPFSRLTVNVAFEPAAVPKTDSFKLFFLASNPSAGSEEIKIERVENLRGAKAVIVTDRGKITLALAPEAAPLATRNFVRLAESGYYRGIAFHNISKGLCIQAGDPDSKTGDVQKIPGTGGNTFNGQPIPLERSQAKFERGTVGLARTPDLLYRTIRSSLAQQYQVETDTALDAKLAVEWPSFAQMQENAKSLTSATSQFFICTALAPHFVGRYAAFAKVIEGMEVVDAIEKAETLGAKAENPEFADRPILATRIADITIERAVSAARPK